DPRSRAAAHHPPGAEAQDGPARARGARLSRAAGADLLRSPARCAPFGSASLRAALAARCALRLRRQSFERLRVDLLTFRSERSDFHGYSSDLLNRSPACVPIGTSARAGGGGGGAGVGADSRGGAGA